MESQSTINWLEEKIRGNVNMSNRDFRKLWILVKEAKEFLRSLLRDYFIRRKGIDIYLQTREDLPNANKF